jgi:hypothetical protein
MRSKGNNAGEDLVNKWMKESKSIELFADAFCAGVSVRVIGKITNFLGGTLVVKGVESEVTVQMTGARFEMKGERVVVPLRSSGGSCFLTPIDN